MADKPVLLTIAGGAVYTATKLNAILDQLAEGVENGLGRGGVNESPNSMTGNLDMDANEIINVGTPTSPNAAANRAFVEAASANIDIDTATATDLLEAIKAVDGTGSGLDADMLNGFNADLANFPSTIVVRNSFRDVSASNFLGDLVGSVRAADSTVVLDAGTDGTDATFTGDVIGNADTATLANTVTPATKSEAQAGGSSTKAVTPSVAHYHDGAIKAWGAFRPIFIPNNPDNLYNVTSVTPGATGVYVVILAVGFSFTSSYGVVCSAADTVACTCNVTKNSANQFTITTFNASGAAVEPDDVFFTVFGNDLTA